MFQGADEGLQEDDDGATTGVVESIPEFVLQGDDDEAATGAVESITEFVNEFLYVPETVVQIALTVLILAVGWYLSKLVVRLAGRTIARRIERPSITRSVLRGIRVSILLVTVVVVALVFDVGTPTILLSVTVISAVVAIVLAPLVASLINGLFILTDRPFEIGDMIEVTDEGHRGFVENITIRYTKIFTLDNTFLVIPNSEIHERDVVNYSAEDERTRLSIRFEITYESDLVAARRNAERAARNVEDVITGGPDIRIGSARYTAAPRCFIEEYAEDGIRLKLRFWVSHPYQLMRIRSEVQRRIWERYADADVEIAYPHRHHVFDDTSGAVRVAVGDGRVPEPDGDDRRDARASAENRPGSVEGEGQSDAADGRESGR